MIALTVESGNAVSDGVRNGSHAPAAGTIVVVPAGAPPTADANRSRVISVDSIPMEPAPNPMPVAGKVARPAPSASAKLAPLKIDLDAPRPTPQRDRDSLPENPYKH